MIGKNQLILTDGLSRKAEKTGETQWSGRTSGNKIVNFICEDKTGDLTGRMVLVRIEEAHSHSLKGKPIDIRERMVKGGEGYAA